jgi:hypothetical protein
MPEKIKPILPGIPPRDGDAGHSVDNTMEDRALGAPAEIAGIFMEQRGQHGILEEILAGDVGLRRAESLHVGFESAAVFGVLVIPLRDPGASRRRSKGKRVNRLLHKKPPLVARTKGYIRPGRIGNRLEVRDDAQYAVVRNPRVGPGRSCRVGRIRGGLRVKNQGCAEAKQYSDHSREH